MGDTLAVVGLVITLGLALLGWAYQLGFMGARVLRSEKDISTLQLKQERAEKEQRDEVKQVLEKVLAKIDELPCHNPGWKKEQC
jgi:hypothetical protein